MQVLTHALASCGRPLAQSALVKVMRSRVPEGDTMEEMIPMLAVANQPTKESEVLLTELALLQDGKISSMAQLALGAMARSLAVPSPSRSGAIVLWFMRQLEAATEPRQLRLLLLVLGNVGADQSLGVIRRRLTAGEPEVRGAAVWALRFQASPEAEADMSRMLTKDQDPSVRLSAVQGLAYRPMNKRMMEAHRHALMNDKSESVRMEALSNLAKAREKWPEAEKLLRMAASEDPSKDVREAALEWLE